MILQVKKGEEERATSYEKELDLGFNMVLIITFFCVQTYPQGTGPSLYLLSWAEANVMLEEIISCMRRADVTNVGIIMCHERPR